MVQYLSAVSSPEISHPFATSGARCRVNSHRGRRVVPIRTKKAKHPDADSNIEPRAARQICAQTVGSKLRIWRARPVAKIPMRNLVPGKDGKLVG